MSEHRVGLGDGSARRHRGRGHVRGQDAQHPLKRHFSKQFLERVTVVHQELVQLLHSRLVLFYFALLGGRRHEGNSERLHCVFKIDFFEEVIVNFEVTFGVEAESAFEVDVGCLVEELKEFEGEVQVGFFFRHGFAEGVDLDEVFGVGVDEADVPDLAAVDEARRLDVSNGFVVNSEAEVEVEILDGVLEVAV